MVWPGSAMTRLTRSLLAGPGQRSSGGWVNTTMSPWCTSCQLKNAFQTRIRSPISNVDSMDEVGIEKAWNTNARTPSASDNATRRATAHPASVRPRRRAGGIPAGPWLSLAASPETPSKSAVLAMAAPGAVAGRLRRGDAGGYGGRGAGGTASHAVTALIAGPVVGRAGRHR